MKKILCLLLSFLYIFNLECAFSFAQEKIKIEDSFIESKSENNFINIVPTKFGNVSANSFRECFIFNYEIQNISDLPIELEDIKVQNNIDSEKIFELYKTDYTGDALFNMLIGTVFAVPSFGIGLLYAAQGTLYLPFAIINDTVKNKKLRKRIKKYTYIPNNISQELKPHQSIILNSIFSNDYSLYYYNNEIKLKITFTNPKTKEKEVYCYKQIFNAQEKIKLENINPCD